MPQSEGAFDDPAHSFCVSRAHRGPPGLKRTRQETIISVRATGCALRYTTTTSRNTSRPHYSASRLVTIGKESRYEVLCVYDWSRYRGVCFLRVPTAEAGCQLIHATHSAISGKGCRGFTSTCPPSAYDLQRSSGWNRITLSAHPVQGDPFWKAVRPNGVPAHARLQPDLVTAQFYTTVFTGVVVRYVCTTGSSVCGQ